MSQGKPELIVSVSGIRGIVGETLTPEVALAFARALGTHVAGRPVVVSRDGRPSGEMLQAAVLAGLMSAGCPVHLLDIAPTPTCGLAVRLYQAAGGVQITASHNPPPYNGLKLFGPQGMVLTPAEGEAVLEVYRAGRFRNADGQTVGLTQHASTNAPQEHLNRVLAQVDVAAIRTRRFHVLLDANHGAGGPLGLALLDALGCRVTPLGCESDGRFAHTPEPTEENLRDVSPRVQTAGCDMGFALDPDSDRLAVIDETGRYIGEELTLALAAEFRLRQQRGPVVVNMSTSRVMEDIAARHGCSFHRAAVGEVNVAVKMQQLGAVLGGEGNGGVIDPRIGFVRDPFIGMAMILNLLAAAGQPLSRVVAALPHYEIVKDKRTVERSLLPALYARLEEHWPEAKRNREDGLRLDWPDRWLHIRPSNTEPIVRIIAEAPTADEARRLCAEAACG